MSKEVVVRRREVPEGGKGSLEGGRGVKKGSEKSKKVQNAMQDQY